MDEITITPTVNESNATFEYLDSSDTEITDANSGKTGQQVSLSVGANTIKVRVTAEDTTTTNPYTVVVTRAAAAPGAPTGLAATANGPSRIDLAWTAPVDTRRLRHHRLQDRGLPRRHQLVRPGRRHPEHRHHPTPTCCSTPPPNAITASPPSTPWAPPTPPAATMPPPRPARSRRRVNEVPVDWALKPADIGVGEQFRLMFVSSTTRGRDLDRYRRLQHLRRDPRRGGA